MSVQRTGLERWETEQVLLVYERVFGALDRRARVLIAAVFIVLVGTAPALAQGTRRSGVDNLGAGRPSGVDLLGRGGVEQLGTGGADNLGVTNPCTGVTCGEGLASPELPPLALPGVLPPPPLPVVAPPPAPVAPPQIITPPPSRDR